jgi:glycosyltransferase involved in cell wall biosynthesis
MKIQFAITEYLPDVFGGAEVYTHNLATALAERGHEVSVVSPGIVRRNTEEHEDVTDGIPVHRFAFVPHHITPAEYAVRFYPELYDEALEWFRGTRPDVVHVTNSWFMAPVVFAAATCGIPVIGTHVDFLWHCKESHLLKPDGESCDNWPEQDCRACHADLKDEEWDAVWSRRQAMYRLQAEVYALHHCPCQLLAEQILALGANPETVEVWPYGVPDSLLLQRRTKHSGDTLHLGFIGRWNRIKGIDVLLDAMALLKDRQDIELHLYGEQEVWNSDDYGAEMAEKAAALKQVFNHGRFEPSELGKVHQSIDCMVTPSIWPENSPVSIQESLALGTPVICADGAGMTNLIEHGRSGLVFVSRNAASLAERVVALADDTELLGRLQRNAKCLGRISEDVARFEGVYTAALPASCKLAGRMTAWMASSL